MSSSASAACWEDVIDDWSKDEQVGIDHPQKCYTEALKKMPQDLRYYSNAEDVIRAALREKRQGLRGLEGLEGTGEEDPGSGSGDNNGGSSGGPFQTALKVGPDNVDSIPLPLMIMAIAALMLIAAGGAGLVSRRLNARRAVPTAGEPPDTP